MSLKTFFGILPPRLLYSDMPSPAETLEMPARLTLLWAGQTQSDIATSVGDNIKTGQDIAGFGKGPFISNATGRIEEFSAFQGHDGKESLALSISPNPKDTFDHSLTSLDDFSKIDPQELRSAINRAGFTALSSISSDPSVWPSVDTVVITALDNDLLCISNQQALRDNADQLEDIIQVLLKATKASRCILAVPENLSDIVRNISPSQASVVRVPPVYPKGLPEMLARDCGAGFLMKKTNAGIIGNTIVVSVEHAAAMAACLKEGKVFTEKTITFSSGKNGSLKNYRVRIGTPISEVLKKAGVELQPKGKLILNGIMQGYACFSDEQPITATTQSIHVQLPSETYLFEDIACLNCGKCSAICPVNLEVNLLGRFAEYGIFDKCRKLGAENCIECGLCAYVCPAHRPLVQFIGNARHILETEQIEELSMQEAMVCDSCDHPCEAIRLFDTSDEENTK